MTHAKRMMHLAIQAAAPGHPAGWRLPGGKRQANEDVAHYQNVARICERALLDVLFLADSPSFTDDGRSPTRSLDPVVLITACALATERLGLVLTASPSTGLHGDDVGSLELCRNKRPTSNTRPCRGLPR